jgi:acyl-CoA synthetase (AMP-forming)/AMP-acid ligase II
VEHLVLDEDGRPAAEGELVVRGPQRFPGYLDPAENTGRFVRFDGTRAEASGEGGAPGEEHWYRTGDRVTAAGGDLVHLGRLDQQVKIQGYRVEPGEIEAALRALPGVRDAVVLARPGPAGQVVLHAAYTGDAGPAALLEALRARLPAYMVPRELSPLDALPLNENGKVDRRALGAVLAPPSPGGPPGAAAPAGPAGPRLATAPGTR